MTLTRIDGVETSEQFDFGPFNVHQVSFDVDALKSVEIVRSANSALYGSDALGGVVSLFTKDPADYLRGRRFHAGAKTTWDGRADTLSGNAALAGGGERLQASLFASTSRGGEIRQPGDRPHGGRHPHGAQPAAPRRQRAGAGQGRSSPRRSGNVLRASGEVYDTRVETEVLSQQGLSRVRTRDSASTPRTSTLVDTQDRLRLSLDHTLAGRGGPRPAHLARPPPAQRHGAGGRRPPLDARVRVAGRGRSGTAPSTSTRQGRAARCRRQKRLGDAERRHAADVRGQLQDRPLRRPARRGRDRRRHREPRSRRGRSTRPSTFPRAASSRPAPMRRGSSSSDASPSCRACATTGSCSTRIRTTRSSAPASIPTRRTSPRTPSRRRSGPRCA